MNHKNIYSSRVVSEDPTTFLLSKNRKKIGFLLIVLIIKDVPAYRKVRIT